MVTPDTLFRSPNALAPEYSHFRVAERLLLTGHSHQAWPDRSLKGQRQAWMDAAKDVDEKWDCAFAKADRVRAGFARLLDDADGHIALASSTHDLVVRFLSALPLRDRPLIVTTDCELATPGSRVTRCCSPALMTCGTRIKAKVTQILIVSILRRTYVRLLPKRTLISRSVNLDICNELQRGSIYLMSVSRVRACPQGIR